jgi:ribosomal protein S18 acetylase RimI-like enzyme
MVTKMEDILKCTDYVMNDKGGNIVVVSTIIKLLVSLFLTNTGMKDFIPENIVYIAVDNSQRGKGYGKQLMQKAISILKEI